MIDLLALPGFFLVVFLMYWSLPLAAITLYMPVWNFWGPVNFVFQWCKFLLEMTGTKVRKYGKQEVYRGGPCLFLSNHRSWTDFFMDCYLTEGRAQTMSRMAVAYAFPMFMIPVCLIRGCIAFKRGSIKDKVAFNNWIDKCIEASPNAGLLIFPEGHRSTQPQSLPLKRGIIHYAYSRKLPVQVVMTQHKEDLISEKAYQVGFGSTCITGYSPVLSTADYASFDEFWGQLQATWDDMWLKVFSADAEGLPPLVLQPPLLNYTTCDRAVMLLFATGGLALMTTLLWLTARLYLTVVAVPLAAALHPALYWVAAPAPVALLLLSIVTHTKWQLPRPTLTPSGEVINYSTKSSSSSRKSKGSKAS